MFYKLKRTWSHNDINYIPDFRETFPELKHLSSEELCDRFSSMNVDFYIAKKVSTPFLTRLTLPFALVLLLLMFIGLPLVFMITGNWGYGVGENARLNNWFKSLRLNV